jgi:hypothetical protein
LECNKFYYEEFVSLFELTDFIKKIITKEVVFENLYLNALLNKVWLREMDLYEPQTETQKQYRGFKNEHTKEDFHLERLTNIRNLLSTLHPENFIFRNYVKILDVNFAEEDERNTENT